MKLRIIDKNKDYYDYLAHQADSDDEVTFDRRGSIPLRHEDFFTILSKHVKEYKYQQYRYWFFPKEPVEYNKLFAVRAGVALFLIGLKLEIDESDFRNCILKSYKMELIKTFEDFDYRGKVLDIVSVECERHYTALNKKKLEKIKLSELTIENFGLQGGFYILKNIGIPALIPPEKIYYGMETYLFSLKNDRNCESTGLTDNEKIVNHGFDKKTSFRKM